MEFLERIFAWRARIWGALSVAIFALAVIAMFTEEWESFCSVKGHWVVAYTDSKQCYADAETHLDTYGHGAGCRRSDWPMVLFSRLFSLVSF